MWDGGTLTAVVNRAARTLQSTREVAILATTLLTRAVESCEPGCDARTLAHTFTDDMREHLLHELLASPFVWRGSKIVPLSSPEGRPLLAPVAAGESEIGVQYGLTFVPWDFWAVLLKEVASVVDVEEPCHVDSAVLQCHGQRGLLVVDKWRRQLTFMVRGDAPARLRRVFHCLFVDAMRRLFPANAAASVHVWCHVCLEWSNLGVVQKTPYCEHVHGKQDVDEGLPPDSVQCLVDFMSSESEQRFRRELFVGNAVKARHSGKGRWMAGRVIAKVRTGSGSGSGFLYTVKYDVDDEDYFSVPLDVSDLLS